MLGFTDLTEMQCILPGLQADAKALNTSAIEVTWSIPSNQAVPLTGIVITYHKPEEQEKVINLTRPTTQYKYIVGGLGKCCSIMISV